MATAQRICKRGIVHIREIKMKTLKISKNEGKFDKRGRLHGEETKAVKREEKIVSNMNNEVRNKKECSF